MSNFINYSVLITAIWLIVTGLTMQTGNFKSAMLFKVIPFGLGMCCLFSAGKLFGWLG